MKSPDKYFEDMRKLIDELTDEHPLDKGLWLNYSDLLDAINILEQGYRRVRLVKETGNADTGTGNTD